MDSSRYPVMVAAGLLAIASWHPFDASLDIGGIASKVRTFVADPWQAGTIGDEALDLLRYAFLGGAAARWFEGARVGRARMVAALVAASAAVAFELSQTIIGSRMPGLEDMLVGIAGGLVGASIGPRARQAPRLVAALVIALSVLATAGLLLTPFELASAWRPFGLMPFLGYYQYTSGQTVSHVVELMLAFLPIGYAWTSVSVQPGYRFLIAVVLMAGTLEYLQGWIVGRYPDVTDVMMMTLGALAGAWMGRGRLR
jgi:VanZ family protein